MSPAQRTIEWAEPFLNIEAFADESLYHAPSLTVTPLLEAITPDSVVEGSDPLTVTVNGRSFMQLAEIVADGTAQPTVRLSQYALQTQIDPRSYGGPKTIDVTVRNPGEQESNHQVFTVYKAV
jgi:hypothetical protein